MKTRIWFMVVAMMCVAATLDAQVYRGGYRGPLGGWWGGYGGGFGATTAQEGIARGQADIIRAQGEAYEAATRGAIDYEQARGAYLENKLRWHEVMVERQKMGEQQRQEKYAAERAARERRQNSASSAPPQAATMLSDAQYDRGTGVVNWPEALQVSSFATSRSELEELLKLRAHTGSTSDVNARISSAAKSMMSQLKQQIRNLPPMAYIEGRNFLDLLIDEVTASVG